MDLDSRSSVLGILGLVATLTVGGAAIVLTAPASAAKVFGWLVLVVGVLVLAGAYLRAQRPHGPLTARVLSNQDEPDILPWHVSVQRVWSVDNRPLWNLALMLHIRVQNPQPYLVQLNGVSAELYDVRRGPRRIKVPLRRWPKRIPMEPMRISVEQPYGGEIAFPRPIPSGEHLDLYLNLDFDVGLEIALSRRFHRIAVRVEAPAGDTLAELPASLLPPDAADEGR